VVLLLQERISQVLQPVELVVQHREHLGKEDQRLHAVVPGVLLERLVELIALDLRVLLDEARGLHDLERVRRGHENLGQQLVGMQRDRRHQLIDLLGTEWLWRPLRHCRRRQERGWQEHDRQHEPRENLARHVHDRPPAAPLDQFRRRAAMGPWSDTERAGAAVGRTTGRLAHARLIAISTTTQASKKPIETPTGSACPNTVSRKRCPRRGQSRSFAADPAQRRSCSARHSQIAKLAAPTASSTRTGSSTPTKGIRTNKSAPMLAFAPSLRWPTTATNVPMKYTRVMSTPRSVSRRRTISTRCQLRFALSRSLPEASGYPTMSSV